MKDIAMIENTKKKGKIKNTATIFVVNLSNSF